MRPIAIAVVAVCFAAAFGQSLRAQTSDQRHFVSIGTGGVTGVYYPAGLAICQLVDNSRDRHGFRCIAEPSGGSLDNIRAIESGSREFGIVQSDVQANAYQGRGQWDKGAFEDLRAVFSLHAEPVTMLARTDAGITTLEDIAGKRVNIGNPGSGQYATWEVMEAEGLVDRNSLGEATQLKSADVGQALCEGKLDSYFWLVGHPSALTQETISSCEAKLVSVGGKGVESLLAKYPYYRKAVIPAGMYNNKEDIETFGVGATFITSKDISDEIVYAVVKSVFDDFETFKSRHPAFEQLTIGEMIRDSLTAPLHPGAKRYYLERGWLDSNN
ncbi:TAXI family TRAP transporter solute-binding subunit [Rhizobiales bacterium]|uniref:TAXI family TRAP transporter solute-binding subunit n=1 Tax=Hongsoonwoonella zoysiae TaxID=2821844 RepID=UPI00155FD0CE|nr:TAXI family TRAP transporter solute-binding subunit [Hongsoonwoonella zoysiae]NRG18739.1 TAXI family TRAP transporter solute-binding subunit [Hongsoonwoonella zoysiae]